MGFTVKGIRLKKLKIMHALEKGTKSGRNSSISMTSTVRIEQLHLHVEYTSMNIWIGCKSTTLHFQAIHTRARTHTSYKTHLLTFTTCHAQ